MYGQTFKLSIMYETEGEIKSFPLIREEMWVGETMSASQALKGFMRGCIGKRAEILSHLQSVLGADTHEAIERRRNGY